MKYVFVVQLLFFNVFTTFCCSYSSVKIWPPTLTKLSTNPVFVVTMLGADYTDNMRNGRFMCLASEYDTIKLYLTDTFKGFYSHSQAVLRVEKKLRSNTYYRVLFDSTIPEYTINEIYEGFTSIRKNDSVSSVYDGWPIVDEYEEMVIPSSPLIRFNKSYYVGLFTSCQNLAADFKVKNNNTNPVVYKLTLSNKSTHQQFFVLPNQEDSLLYIDYDMMGIRDFLKYKLNVEAMDHSGHLSETSKTIKFHTPYYKAITMRAKFVLLYIFGR